MRLAALFSGGKDSTYAIFRAMKQGHKVECLATIKPNDKDSFMYHTPNLHLTQLCAEAMDLPLVESQTEGEKEKELFELEELLAELKKGTGIEGVVSGANASKYQNERIQAICERLGLESITPLWGMDPVELIAEMLRDSFEIVIVKVAAHGLDEKWLGRTIDEDAMHELLDLNLKFCVSPIGEGGEFETLVVDCPLYGKKIQILESKKKWDGSSGEMEIIKAGLVEKKPLQEKAKKEKQQRKPKA